ncbi:MAG: xanthine dehydrogenase family protein molybdopterin-binding subunit [Proteobacteria bacterium]|nr:MAG: xanthine dehydrogenase family protein molybdopterin-binding subunit [Pseudomonadota bacterium]
MISGHNKQVGQARNRVEGPVKVSGEARYAAEYKEEGLLYGYVLSSGIAKGKILSIDLTEANKVPGLVAIYSHLHRPQASKRSHKYSDEDKAHGEHFRPLLDDKIVYSGQPIALAVAETFEAAREAARSIRIEYKSEPHETDLLNFEGKGEKPSKNRFPPPKNRGNADKAYKAAEVKIAVEYICPAQHHNPMEMFASTVLFSKEDESLTIYDKTQGVMNSQSYVCNIFGLSSDKVRVLSPFMGGGFGSGLRPQYQLFLAVLAALDLKKSVKVSLTRQQMFTFGHRPKTMHKMELSAARDGTLTSMKHEVLSETSQFEEYTENVVSWSGEVYQCENASFDYKLAKLDVYTPIDMRAPGATWGVYALESAIDELAAEVGMDSLAFRLKNYSEMDQNTGKPYSSKELRECYRQGAEAFGWHERPLGPGRMKSGHHSIGWGMATGIWEAMQMYASASAKLHANGHLEVSSATSDIGTGTYTIMTQIAADAMGLPLEKVEFKLGDSKLPKAPLEGGSWTAATVGMAVHDVCQKVATKAFKTAQGLKDSPLAKLKFEDVEFIDGMIRSKKDPSKEVSLTAIVQSTKEGSIEDEVTALPNLVKQKPYTRNTHSAVFVEVKVDEELGIVEVTRVVAAIAGGRILNPKTARSQILGGVVWGISTALHEHSVMDLKQGRFINHDLAGYHFSANKDIPEIEVIFVPEDDTIVNPLGIKGLGEIGIVGTAAAVANAIYHATGKRVRDLPITVDKLL